MTAEPSHPPEAEVVEICRDLIRFDTSNYGNNEGPGERKAAEHVASLLDEVGIEAELFESHPGRTTLVARWGDHSAGDALLVHGHLDVVPAQATDWQVDPFAGEIQDGYLWGRGAIDMKDFDAMVLSVVRARTRAGRIPGRPIVLCFTADEEAGGLYGARWLAEHHREALEGCSEAIGEVGGYSVTLNGQRLYLIQTAEKGMVWLRLRAKGAAGHGSLLQERKPDHRTRRSRRASGPPLLAGGDRRHDDSAARRDRGHHRRRRVRPRPGPRALRSAAPDARRRAEKHQQSHDA
jgi:acetylornithine deacetylase/succinyl-diaminopimelate desuccinylase-like protein